MMANQSPLRKHHEDRAAAEAAREPSVDAAERPGAASGRRIAAAVEHLPYGPPRGDGAVCEIPATFGSVESEYAAIRRSVGLVDAAHRGTVRVTGADRSDFLNRMVTQELAGAGAGSVRASFWLNRKGRIDADLLVVELGDEMLIDLDVHQAAATVESLDAFIFTEDVALEDATESTHRIQMHGPAAAALLAHVVEGDDPALEPHAAARVRIGGIDVVAARRDQVGETGLDLFVALADAERAWTALLDAAVDRPARPVGWYAFNIARIEAGTPLFNVDFGTTNLPHETGVLDERVSFKKGCYLGQEVVARMQSLGRPKQMLMGLRLHSERLPVADAEVFAVGEGGGVGDQVGVITSSTISPMLGGAPIAFAMLRTAEAEEGAKVLVSAEGEHVEAEVGGLRMWQPTA
jgi:folate-binding protein YgfZ